MACSLHKCPKHCKLHNCPTQNTPKPIILFCPVSNVSHTFKKLWCVWVFYLMISSRAYAETLPLHLLPAATRNSNQVSVQRQRMCREMKGNNHNLPLLYPITQVWDWQGRKPKEGRWAAKLGILFYLVRSSGRAFTDHTKQSFIGVWW